MKRIQYILFFWILMSLIHVNAQEFDGVTTGLDIERYKPENADNTKNKTRQMKQLVSNAVKHFEKVAVEDACYDFIYNPIWRKGELFVFVYDENGVCYAHGDDSDLIWQNISHIKSVGGMTLIKDMLKAGPNGKTMGYIWDGAYKSSFVKTIVKDGLTYILGTGFFPENEEYTTKQLVKSAVSYLQEQGKDLVFDLINSPEGPFTNGNIYTFAYDLNGICVAHGQNLALVGQNIIDMVDSKGVPLIKNLIDIAKTKGKGWYDYYWRNEYKRTYLELVTDPKTKKQYVIAAGYYPYQDFESVQSLVNKAIAHLKEYGAEKAFTDFSNQSGEFVQGGLSIFSFNLEGKLLASGEYPGFVGQNLIKRTDSEGKFFVKEIIDIAKKRSEGIINFYEKNAITIGFFKKVETPDGIFIIGSRYYPNTKAQSVKTLVEKAINYLQTHPDALAFHKFSTRSEAYYRGDLHIFVYNTKGVRLVNGLNKGQIWRNFIKTTDQEGKTIIQDIIATAINGGGWVNYKTRNAERRVFVRLVTKQSEVGEPQSFVVGSGYFL